MGLEWELPAGGMLMAGPNRLYYSQITQRMREVVAAATLDACVAGFHAERAEGDILPI